MADSLASLPMYDLPELRAATDAWWAGLARAFRQAGLAPVPERLSREGDPGALWRLPELLISQTCGYPLTHAYRDSLALVATPCYGAEGCGGPLYRSAILVRADDPSEALEDLRGRRAAFNGRNSQSGYNCLRHLVAPLAEGGTFFAEAIETGSHAGSLAAVAEGRAAVAAADCVTFALLARHRPAAVADLRVLTWSAPAPGLPYVTTQSCSPEQLERLRAGLAEALADPATAAAREALLIDGVEVLPTTAYQVILDMEQEAARAGYPQLS